MTLYRLASEVREIAEDLIATVEDHKPLERAQIVYIFRDKAPVSKGRLVLGRARRIGGLPAFLTGFTPDDHMVAPSPFFVLEISWSTWRDLTQAGQRALIDHELCHLGVDPDSDELFLRGHDLEEFTAIVRRHGLWQADVSAVARAMAEQLAMAIDEITGEITISTWPRSPGVEL